METEKKQYFLRLNPPRPSFPYDLSEEEKTIMQEHAAYWKNYQEQGYVVVYGPVFDPKGVYGMGILEVDDEQQILEFQRNDPALKAGNTYEYFPMKAVMKR